MNLSNLPSTSALAYTIFVTCLGKFVIILSLHKYCSHTHDETKNVERRKMYFHIYTPQVIYKKSLIQWLLKVLQKESVLSRILWPSMEQRKDACFLPLHIGWNRNLLFAIITEQNGVLSSLPFAAWTRLQAIWRCRLPEDLFLRNSNSKGAQGHPRGKL